MTFLKTRPSLKSLRAKWPGSSKRKTSSTTDDIPSPVDQGEARAPVVRPQTDPTIGGGQRTSQGSAVSLPFILRSPSVFIGLDMSARATITFAQPGLQPPVFVVTSLSTPPWEALEMAVSNDKTESGDTVFYRVFENVAQGSHQYKIRIGQGHWVVDLSKKTATDEAGNRNNVVHTELVFTQNYTPLTETAAAAAAAATERRATRNGTPATAGVGARLSAIEELDGSDQQDAGDDAPQMPTVPVPFIVVDKVQDQAQPDYGDVEPESLPIDSAKRAADADADYESVLPATSDEIQQQVEPTQVPIVVVERSDDKPAFGEDFGDDATSGQKLAHELRIADAAPDKVEVKGQYGNAGELSSGPLLSHEAGSSTQGVNNELKKDAPSSDNGHLARNKDISDDLDELGNAPLLSHETGLSLTKTKNSSEANELDLAPLMSHETGFSTESKVPSEDISEFGKAPPMSHETGFPSADTGNSDHIGEVDFAPLMSHEKSLSTKSQESDNEKAESLAHGKSRGDFDNKSLGELDHAPLMSHETGFSTKDDVPSDEVSELDNAPLMSHETGFFTLSKDHSDELSEFDHGPLLPHETGFGASSSGDPDSPIYSDLAPEFPHEGGNASDDRHGGLDDTPLLSHEYPGATGGKRGSGSTAPDYLLQATVYQPPKKPAPVFARRTSSSIWKHRSSSSSLPHSLPRSDAEDENLQDPSLEAFPTQRDRIFERVATISTHLPEDDSVRSPSDTQSPEISVLSQACSSIDLAPISSHTSLHRIAEDALMETEEEEESALGSPVMELSFRSGADTSRKEPAPSGAVDSNGPEIPMSQEKGVEYSKKDKNQQGSDEAEASTKDCSEDAGEASSVQKNDGAGDSAPSMSRRWSPDAIARPATALDPILTAPYTPAERSHAKADNPVDAAGKGTPKMKFADSPAYDGHGDAAAARRPNLFVRAWRKLKFNTA